MNYPFPFFGQGSARADELCVLAVFADPLAADEAQALAALAPEPARGSVRVGPRSLFLQSEGYLTRARAWAGGKKLNADEAYNAVAQALETWAREVHDQRPVALVFVNSMSEAGSAYGEWHRWSIASFAERVRPVVARLRADGEGDHAEWVVTNFLSFGATPSAADVRAHAAEDPPHAVGNIHRRCAWVVRLVDAHGEGVLRELGPYAELGYWACAAVPERVADPHGLPAHLATLAEQCDDKTPEVRRDLLLRAAHCLIADTLPLVVCLECFPDRVAHPRVDHVEDALAIVRTAVAYAPATWEHLSPIVETVRPFGKQYELAIAKLLLPGAITTRTALTEHAVVGWGRELIEHFTAHGLAHEVAELASIELLRAPLAAPEIAVAGAAHPYLARLDARRLTVAYRASQEDQLVRIRLRARPHPNRTSTHPNEVLSVADMVCSGLAGAACFAPELGRAEVVEGPRGPCAPDSTELEWTLHVRAVDPRFWAVALDLLAGPWDRSLEDVRFCPEHVSIEGALAPDGSALSATTGDVLGWIGQPSDDPYRAWAEMPFAVKHAKRGKSPRVSFKTDAPTAEVHTKFENALAALADLLRSHPLGIGHRSANTKVSKTQLTATWERLGVPGEVAAGPILNLARRFHCDVQPLHAVELAL